MTAAVGASSRFLCVKCRRVRLLARRIAGPRGPKTGGVINRRKGGDAPTGAPTVRPAVKDDIAREPAVTVCRCSIGATSYRPIKDGGDDDDVRGSAVRICFRHTDTHVIRAASVAAPTTTSSNNVSPLRPTRRRARRPAIRRASVRPNRPRQGHNCTAKSVRAYRCDRTPASESASAKTSACLDGDDALSRPFFSDADRHRRFVRHPRSHALPRIYALVVLVVKWAQRSADPFAHHDHSRYQRSAKATNPVDNESN
uniref:Uncharacterized protein n=1 Tax=Plectus sambesii TaxID=2011161 RepID=A0A914UVL8_9BILA